MISKNKGEDFDNEELIFDKSRIATKGLKNEKIQNSFKIYDSEFVINHSLISSWKFESISWILC